MTALVDDCKFLSFDGLLTDNVLFSAIIFYLMGTFSTCKADGFFFFLMVVSFKVTGDL